MSDTMLFGVLKMPFEMAMSDEISRLQYYARVQELVGRSAERKPLSATVIGNMMPSSIPMEYDGPLMEFARAIEAAHNIKEGT